MGTNKDIGNGIKNRLQGYIKAPDTMVWDKIEADLKKKKKKRFLFWLFLRGLLLITIVVLLKSSVFESDLKNSKSINNIEEKTEKINRKSTNNPNSSNIILDNNSLENNSNNEKENIKTSDKTINNLISSLSKQNNKSVSLTNSEKTNSNKRNTSSSSENNLITHNKSSNYKNLDKSGNKNSTSSTKQNIDLIANFENLKKVNPKDSIVNKPKSNDKKRDSSKLESIKQDDIERWSVLPYVSFDYFDSFNNLITNNYNTNFGIKLSYYATEDLSIRLGISKLTLNFNAQDPNNLTQQLSYLELPLEFEQNIIKGRINTSLIAGFGYLFNNKTYTNLNNFQTTTTKETNASVNFGVGLNTTIYKRLKFNFEPIFKYHIKALENNLKSQTFTLSIIGGIEYRF